MGQILAERQPMTLIRYDQPVPERPNISLRPSPDAMQWLRDKAGREHRTVTSLATHYLLSKIAEVRAGETAAGPAIAPDGSTPGQIRTDEAT